MHGDRFSKDLSETTRKNGWSSRIFCVHVHEQVKENIQELKLHVLPSYMLNNGNLICDGLSLKRLC